MGKGVGQIGELPMDGIGTPKNGVRVAEITSSACKTVLKLGTIVIPDGLMQRIKRFWAEIPKSGRQQASRPEA